MRMGCRWDEKQVLWLVVERDEYGLDVFGFQRSLLRLRKK